MEERESTGGPAIELRCSRCAQLSSAQLMMTGTRHKAQPGAGPVSTTQRRVPTEVEKTARRLTSSYVPLPAYCYGLVRGAKSRARAEHLAAPACPRRVTLQPPSLCPLPRPHVACPSAVRAMTAPLHTTQHAAAIAAIAASQHSAPVAEFRCLFTHDVRRKQKRWQDGFLKFHSFNNRVMVYDQARNFLGDTYYKDSDELHEGDELNLNNGALVEVSEPVGVTHTDLTAVLSKKTKDPPAAPNAPSQSKPFQRPSSVAPPNTHRSASQLRHKSLNTLLGTPKGPIGKAQPIKSPYEARKDREKENELVEERVAKRQRTGQAPASWRASSPAQEDDVAADNALPRLAKAAGTRNAQQPKRFIPPTATVITIDSEPDLHPATFSDVTLPSTPPQVAGKREESRTIKTAIPRQPPARTPKIPKGKVPLPGVRALETPKQRAPPSSPPVSAANRLSNIEFALQPVEAPPKEPSPPPVPSPPPARKARCLRLSTGVKRGKLLCQALPTESAKNASEPRVTGIKARRTALRVADDEPSPVIPQESNASISIKRSKCKRVLAQVDQGSPKRAKVFTSPSLPSPRLEDDPEIVHGLMDQQLLIASSPTHPQLASSPPVEGVPDFTPTAQTTISKAPLQANVAEPVAAISKPSSGRTVRKGPVKKKAERSRAAPKVSPPEPIMKPATTASRDVSPAHTEASETQSRTSSTSPRKLPFSTGSITKRTVHSTKKKSTLTKSIPDVLPPQAPVESIPLPPHPLRASKTGPLMSTTELAGLLQKPKNLAKALADPIEDEGDTSHAKKSPTRSFRRVRSENDAPIPSISEEWERLNLPKTSKPVTDVANEPAKAGTADGAKKTKKDSGLGALIKKTDPRRKFKRTQSLQVDTNVAPPLAAGEEVSLPSPVVDVDVGPWSTEAGDLFDWRPPGRD
jgi:hypothetical protein